MNVDKIHVLHSWNYLISFIYFAVTLRAHNYITTSVMAIGSYWSDVSPDITRTNIVQELLFSQKSVYFIIERKH